MAHKKVMRGKRHKSYATKNNYHFMSYLNQLRSELQRHTYQPGKYHQFYIFEPKKRIIQAPGFRDQIVHQAIHHILEPFYERHFFQTSYACRKNLGTHKAQKNVEKLIRHNPELYACSLDISKYFASINHGKLKQILKQNIADQKLLRLLGKIIDSTDSGCSYDHLFSVDSPVLNNSTKGIPIGNLTSQLFANIYLHQLDSFAKRHLKIRKYHRYMDDILFFHPDKEQLLTWQKQITEFLRNKLYLELNPRKVRVYPVRYGVDFVGYVMYPNRTRIRGSSVKRFKKRYRRSLKLTATGQISQDSLLATFDSFIAHISHGDSYGLAQNLQKWQTEYLPKELIINDKEPNNKSQARCIYSRQRNQQIVLS